MRYNSKKWAKNRFMATAAAAVFGAAPGAALAQATAEGGTQASGGLEEIVVTAQKRSENLQNVPITINAVTSAQIQAQGINTTDRLVVATPGLVFAKGPAGPQIYLRGVGTKGTSTGEEGTNAVYIDGVYQGSLPASIFDLSTIERVEVLKGPQGTLFGRNATGGAINVITADPSFSFHADGRVGYANYDTIEGMLHISTPVTQDIAVDGSVLYRDQGDGWGKSNVTGRDVNKSKEFYARSKLLWNLDDSTQLRLSFNASAVTDLSRGAFTLLPGAVAIGGSTHQGGFYDVDGEFGPRSRVTRLDGYAKFTHEFDNFQISNLAAYSQTHTRYLLDQDGSSLPIVQARLNDHTNQFTNEFQVQSLSSSKVSWVAGVFYLYQTANVDPIDLRGLSQGANVFTIRYNEQITHSIAGFAQTTVPITDTTNITAGLRYTHDERRAEGRQTTALAATTFVYPDRTLDSGKLTWRLAVDQKLGKRVMVYASYNRGFKSGLFSLFSGSNVPPVRPEVIDAYEVGVKSELFDRAVRINGSAFWYDYKNVQLSQQLAGTGSILRNAANARVKGVDLDIVVAPVQRLTLRGGAEYIDAKYRSFPGAPMTIPNRNAAGVLTGGNTTIFGDAAGNDMILAPKLTLSISADYALKTAVGDFDFSGSYYYNNGYYYEPDNRLRQPHYDLVSAQIKWTAPSDRFGVRVYVNNVANTKYTTNENSSVNDVYTPGNPRTFGVSLNFKFR